METRTVQRLIDVGDTVCWVTSAGGLVAANPDSPIREPLDFRRLFAGLLLLVLAALFFSMIAPFLEALVLGAIFSTNAGPPEYRVSSG
ncbi:MAG TPA: hypothetical protein VKA43_17135 [Gammaproteobacteria bacterium]|nr:hypothetical protein [Gammaproteobacteria bacterium]